MVDHGESAKTHTVRCTARGLDATEYTVIVDGRIHADALVRLVRYSAVNLVANSRLDACQVHT
jgi:hypothetical protein